MLEVEEALESELVRAREMVIEFEQPGAGMVKAAGGAGQALAHARAGPQRPVPRWASTPSEVLGEAGFSEEEIVQLLAGGAVAGAAGSSATASPFLAS